MADVQCIPSSSYSVSKPVAMPHRSSHLSQSDYTDLSTSTSLEETRSMSASDGFQMSSRRRGHLIQLKTKALYRLNELGYDKNGVYVKHRPELMAQKQKVVNRLKSLGIDPFTGIKIRDLGRDTYQFSASV
eukprot:TRINITY_DN640_c0_g1_i2.p1 TRINITY_DN640_c0_g1~~TRINITY_DN640_c0_g1_i2.p1  ORF type:complete len:131 (+),score=9.99 TRINITY_DN640_c0_g1_i2:65-457(+)